MDPIGDALGRWDDPLDRGPVTRADFSAQGVPDIDGDGVEEQAVYAAYKGCAGMGGNCVHLLYVSGKACGAYAGSFYGAIDSMEVLPERRADHHEFRVLSQDGCAGRAGKLLRFRWNGASYAEAQAISCSCPDDGPARGRHRACPP